MPKVEDACRIAGCHDFIGRLPNGYDFILGEHGMNLSEGQRQTIAIARAIIRDPKILILDEPTSSMDGQLEASFIENIKEFAQDKTLILTTHKSALIQLTDRTMIVVGGKLAANGPRDEILNHLANSQNNNQV